MKTFLCSAILAVCVSGAGAQNLAFVRNEPGAGFIDIAIPANRLALGANDVTTIPVTNGNALFPPGGSWTIGNKGAMGYNVPEGQQSLGGVNAPIPPGNLPGPLFGGLAKALAPGWDDEGDSVAFPAGVFALVAADRLIVQWNRMPVGNAGDTTTFQVQVPFGVTLDCGVYARFIYTDVENPTVNGGAIFSIGYQDGGLEGQNSNAPVSFNQPGVIQNGDVLSLTCALVCAADPNCPADQDGDLDIDSDDIVRLFSNFADGDVCGDQDGDEDVDSDDLNVFFGRFETGGCN